MDDVPDSITKGDFYNLPSSYTISSITGGNVECKIGNMIYTNTSVLEKGTYEIICTATTGAGNFKTITKDIEVTYEPYEITNLVVDGSFEYEISAWINDNAEIVDGGYEGNKMLKCNHDNGNDVSSLSLQFIEAPILNHKYYGAIMFKSSSDFLINSDYTGYMDARYEWHYIDDLGIGNMVYANKDYSTNDWIKLSSISAITDSKYLLNSDWQIRNFVRGAYDYSYTDNLIIIDLTETFGEGNEPNKEWCDKHIQWFDGTTTIYK